MPVLVLVLPLLLRPLYSFASGLGMVDLFLAHGIYRTSGHGFMALVYLRAARFWKATVHGRGPFDMATKLSPDTDYAAVVDLYMSYSSKQTQEGNQTAESYPMQQVKNSTHACMPFSHSNKTQK
jgi:hypothetical protein